MGEAFYMGRIASRGGSSKLFFRSGAHASVGLSLFVVKARPKALAEMLVPCMFLFMTDNTQALRDTIQVFVARHSLCPTRLGTPLSWPQ